MQLLSVLAVVAISSFPQAVRTADLPPSIPSACYSACNDALTISTTVGQTPTLCDTEQTGSFYTALLGCYHCIGLENKGNETLTASEINQIFGSALGYCKWSISTSVITPVTGGGTITATGTASGATASVLITGDVTVVTAAETSTAVATAVGAVATSGGDTASRSNAWIAGPIVASVVAVALLGAGAWFLRRRQMRRSAEVVQAAQVNEIRRSVPPPDYYESSFATSENSIEGIKELNEKKLMYKA